VTGSPFTQVFGAPRVADALDPSKPAKQAAFVTCDATVDPQRVHALKGSEGSDGTITWQAANDFSASTGEKIYPQISGRTDGWRIYYVRGTFDTLHFRGLDAGSINFTAEASLPLPMSAPDNYFAVTASMVYPGSHGSAQQHLLQMRQGTVGTYTLTVGTQGLPDAP
jgi:hypothetical protein